jgi:hypothetical protein
LTSAVLIPDWVGADAAPEFTECARRGHLCWRGMKVPPAAAGTAETQEVRRPRSMTLELSRACDAWFEVRFGWRARSDHALFVTGAREQAAQFGTPVIVVPLKPARFLWSPRIRDLTRHLSDAGITAAVGVPPILEAGDYRDRDLGAATASGHEIMVRCERYYWSAVPIG